MARTVGMAMRRSRRASKVERRLEGSGRHGLLKESSRTEPGWRWLAISTRRRVSHIQTTTRGRRESMLVKTGAFWFVVRDGPDRVVRMAKAVDGTTMVLKSLKVNNQSVLRW